MNHLRGMIALIDDAIKKAGVTKRDLTHIAASIGPGSFTGIRIGVVTARTMAQMLGIPCIAVSTLEAMAEGALSCAAGAHAHYIVPVINARRHQTYAAVYEAGPENGTLTAVMEEKQYMIEELLEGLEAKIAGNEGVSLYFTGDGIDAYSEIIESALSEGEYTFAPESSRYQDAEAVAALALAKAKAGKTISYNELLPEYMRLAEAEQRLKAGTLSDRIRTAKV